MIMKAIAASEFGRVAILMGGASAEREISLISGRTGLTALRAEGVDAHTLDVSFDIADQLRNGKFDRAFIILHGRGGEDGQIQGLLQSMNIPFTGSDVVGAVLSMNKMVSKQLWMQQGLPTAIFERVTMESNIDSVVHNLGLPLIIKPVNEGSSIGITKVNSADELLVAIALAVQFDTEVIAESWINGDEYTVAVLDQIALPMVMLRTSHEFYDFEAKYKTDTTEYLCPCYLSEQEQLYCRQLALKAFNGLRKRGWGRIDLMRDQNHNFYLLEANSVPGMTDHSLVPIAAKEFGLVFNELIWKILEISVEVNK